MKLNELPNGTIIKHRNRLYCLQQGLDGRIIVDVNNGTWQFIQETKHKYQHPAANWRTYYILYMPN